MRTYAQIIGIGSYLPERKLTNADLEQMVDTSDEWIVSRTGIRERRIAAEDEATSDLAVIAARRAIDSASVQDSEIDMIILGTSSPDMVFPSTACLVQARLGLSCPAYDVMAACSGFTYALNSATSAIECGRARTVLVIGADALSRHVDFEDRTTCVLFGDGAGAVVVQAADEPGVLGMVLGADGSRADVLKIAAGGSAAPCDTDRIAAKEHRLTMSGNEVFKFAVRVIPQAAREALAASDLGVDDLAWLIPHQANQRIIATVAERLDMPEERVFSHVAMVGNTSAASIPLALDDLYTSGRLAPGDLVALVGFGAGLTWGAGVIRWTLARPNKEN